MEDVAGLEDIALDASSEAAISSADEGEDEVISDEEIEGQDNAVATKKYVANFSFPFDLALNTLSVPKRLCHESRKSISKVVGKSESRMHLAPLSFLLRS